MQGPYNDRWERTKRYLLRNFLVNPGFELSPIPEERSSPASSSSLPELVVERAPDRHDHPAAFYEGLERRMRRYYRHLFLGVTESDDEDPDFEVNRSMASTFIINNNNREGEEARSTATVQRSNDSDDNEEINIRQSDLIDYDDFKGSESLNTSDASQLIDTESNGVGYVSIDSKEYLSGEDDVEDFRLIDSGSRNFTKYSNEININLDIQPNVKDKADEIQVLGDSNDSTKSRLKSNDNQILITSFEAINDIENVSEIIRTKSDSEDSIPCHDIVTTTAEVHGERVERASMRLSEDGSPVILPQYGRFSRSVIGSSTVIRNVNHSIHGVLENFGEIIQKDSSSSHEITEFDKHEASVSIEEDLEIQRSSRTSEVTIASHDSNETLYTAIVLADIESEDHDEKQDKEGAVDDTEHYNEAELIIEDESYVRSSELKEDDDESIGPDEFNYTALDKNISETIHVGKTSNIWDEDKTDDDDSFEFAVRRGVFESKNKRKACAQSSSEEMESSTEELEPVEVMRGPTDAGVRASLIRESVDTVNSPVFTFEAKTSSDKLEEVSSNDSEIYSSLQKGMPNESEEHNTPAADAANELDAFWSVSPIRIDIDKLPNASEEAKKRRIDSDEEPLPKRKRKDHKDVGVQTSSNGFSYNTWEEVRGEFFVGSPLVYRLCGCQNHICS